MSFLNPYINKIPFMKIYPFYNYKALSVCADKQNYVFHHCSYTNGHAAYLWTIRTMTSSHALFPWKS